VVPRLVELAALVRRGADGLAGALLRRSARERRQVELLARRLRDPRRRVADLQAATAALALRIDGAMGRRAATARGRAEGAVHRLALQHPGRRAAALTAALAAHRHRLDLAGRRVLTVARDHLRRLATSLDDLSPLGVLRRGYSLVRRLPERTIVRSGADLGAGDEVEITFAAGMARARVQESHRLEDDHEPE